IKHMSRGWQYFLFSIILVTAFFLNSYFWIVIFIVLGGICGYFLKEADPESKNNTSGFDRPNRRHLYTGLLLFCIAFIGLNFFLKGINHNLLFEFSKVSLTLFGGGYVMIPMMHNIVVDNFHWLSSAEFANAIAFGQVTPGPILVSATYIGFVTGGVVGAFFATLGIFAPSAFVMILLSTEFENIKDHAITKGIMKGIRTVIIALIAYSGWILFKSLDHKLVSALIALSSFVIITYTKFNYFLLILLSGVVALLYF
ncbi:MAG: chromate transporter, partial [Fulvivirga sp.]